MENQESIEMFIMKLKITPRKRDIMIRTIVCNIVKDLKT